MRPLSFSEIKLFYFGRHLAGLPWCMIWKYFFKSAQTHEINDMT